MALERLGPAVTGYPFAGAARVGDQLVIASRNLTPSTLVTYDLRTRRVSATVDVPAGRGAWGVGAVPDSAPAGSREQAAVAYAGQFGAMGTWNLHRLDVASGELEAIAALDAEYLWDIAVSPADGQVFIVGSPNRVIRWDPLSGLAAVVPGMDHVLDSVRSVAVAGRILVVGGRFQGRAVLRTLDLITGAVAQVSPPALAAGTIVYALAATPEWVAAGTEGSDMRGAGVALFGVPEFGAPGLTLADHVQLPDEAVVDALAIDADGPDVAVLATARRSGALYRVAGGVATRLGVPVERSETRGLFLHDGAVVGVSAAELVWSLDLRAAGAQLERVDLLQAGLERRPQLAMSIAAEGAGARRRVHVGGNFTLTSHQLDNSRADTSHVFVPGEAKDLCILDGDLLAAVYPSAQVLRRRTGETSFSLVAQLAPEQFRPVALAPDPARRQVLVSTARDGDVGALHAVRLGGAEDGQVRMARDPFGDGQHPAGIAVDGAVAYLGGSGRRGSLLAWDLAAWRPAWRVDAVRPESGTWVGVAVADGFVVLLGSFGWWATVDIATRSVAVAGRLGSDGGQLLAQADGLYAVTSNGVWRLDPRARTATALTRELASRLWGWPFLAADEAGDIYAIAGLDLARVSAG